MQSRELRGLSHCLLNPKGLVSISSSCTACSDHDGRLHRHLQWVMGSFTKRGGANLVMGAFLKPAFTEEQLRLYHVQLPALGSQDTAFAVSRTLSQARAFLYAGRAAKNTAAQPLPGRAAAECEPAAAPSRLRRTEHLAQEQAPREQEGLPASQQAAVPASPEIVICLEMPLSNGAAAVAEQRHNDAAAASAKHIQAPASWVQQPSAEPAAVALGKGAPLAAQVTPLRHSSRKRAVPAAVPIQLAASSAAGAPGRSKLQSPEAGAELGSKAPAAERQKRERLSEGPQGPGSTERTNSNQGASSRKRKAEESSPQASPGDSDTQPGSTPGSGRKKAKRRGASEQEAPGHAPTRRGSRQAMRAAVSTASSSDSEQPASDGKGNRRGSRQPPSSPAVRPAVGQEPAPAATRQPGGKPGKTRPPGAERRAPLEHGPAATPPAAAKKDGSKQSTAPTSGAHRPALKHEPAAPAAAVAQEEVIDVTMSDEEDQDSVQQGSEEDSGSEGALTGTSPVAWSCS